MPQRNTDGTYRNNNRAMKVSQRSMLARWVEAEVLSLKLLGSLFSGSPRKSRTLVKGGRGLLRRSRQASLSRPTTASVRWHAPRP
jgi:hypothetical protein